MAGKNGSNGSSAGSRVELHETYESLNIEPKPLTPHILAAATVVYGDDYYNGKRETISLSGFVQLNKWPMPGFRHRVDEDGYASFDLELISAPEVGIKGFSYHLNDRIQVLSNPLLPNSGSVRQVVPGQNFPAHFHIRRFGILETSTMRLAHRDVISINGIIDGIPPYKKPLTAPYLGAPVGDGPCPVVPAANVVRGTNLPEAWYDADNQNRAQGIVPKVFFAASVGPCVSMLVDPSMIIQSTAEGRVTLQLDGRKVDIDIFGDHKLAAGTELLLFGPEKHGDGAGVQAQLARTAMVGECPALGGRVMLRASFFKVSKGSLGDGTEAQFGKVKYPSELHLDAMLEIVTPDRVLYACSPVHLLGTLRDVDATGTELRMDSTESVLQNVDGEPVGELTGLVMKVGATSFGEQAYVGDFEVLANQARPSTPARPSAPPPGE